MQTNLKEVSGVKRELELIFSHDELSPFIAKAYSEAQSKANIKGYRQGRVPHNVIKQLMGKEIDEKAMDDFINTQFQNWVKEGGANPIGYPGVVSLDKKLDGSIVCVVAFEVLPQFEIGNYKGIEATRYFHDVTEEDIDSQILNIRQAHAKAEKAEVVENEDYAVAITMTRLGENGEIAEGAVPFPTFLYLRNPESDKQLIESVIGKRQDEFFEYEVYDKVQDTTNKFKVAITEVNKIEVPELTNEFLVSITGDKEATLEKFRDLVKFGMKTEIESQYSDELQNEIVTKIMENHKDKFEVPESITQEVLMQRIESKKDKNGHLPKNFDIEKFVEANESQARETGRWMLIRDRIIEIEDIKVEDIDYEDFAEMEAPRYGVDAEQLVQFFKTSPEIQGKILAFKVMQFLEDNAVITEVPDSERKHEHHDHEHHHHDGDDHEHHDHAEHSH